MSMMGKRNSNVCVPHDDKCYWITHLLERKEKKKKKDKVPDVSDLPGIQPEIAKRAPKEEKADGPGTPVKPKSVSDPEGNGRKKRKRDREEELPTSDKKEKK